jgi:hypothetical protein
MYVSRYHLHVRCPLASSAPSSLGRHETQDFTEEFGIAVHINRMVAPINISRVLIFGGKTGWIGGLMADLIKEKHRKKHIIYFFLSQRSMHCNCFPVLLS